MPEPRAHTDDQARPLGGPLSGPAANYTRGTTPVAFGASLDRLRARAERRRLEGWADVDELVELGLEGSFFHTVATLRAGLREVVASVLGERR